MLYFISYDLSSHHEEIRSDIINLINDFGETWHIISTSYAVSSNLEIGDISARLQKAIQNFGKYVVIKINPGDIETDMSLRDALWLHYSN